MSCQQEVPLPRNICPTSAPKQQEEKQEANSKHKVGCKQADENKRASKQESKQADEPASNKEGQGSKETRQGNQE